MRRYHPSDAGHRYNTGGKIVGCLISYDGGIYPEARKRTFKYYADAGFAMDSTQTETGPGEYYLDSMVIVPEFRGRGIGYLLTKDAIDEAARLGSRKVALLVECCKPRLRDYYAELGFKPECELYAFGDRYLKMTLEL